MTAVDWALGLYALAYLLRLAEMWIDPPLDMLRAELLRRRDRGLPALELGHVRVAYSVVSVVEALFWPYVLGLRVHRWWRRR